MPQSKVITTNRDKKFGISRTTALLCVSKHFMDTPATSLEALKDIRQIMERSGRFISLSGWSGVAAGCWALAGAAIARSELAAYPENGGFQDMVSRGIRSF